MYPAILPLLDRVAMKRHYRHTLAGIRKNRARSIYEWAPPSGMLGLDLNERSVSAAHCRPASADFPRLAIGDMAGLGDAQVGEWSVEIAVGR